MKHAACMLLAGAVAMAAAVAVEAAPARIERAVADPQSAGITAQQRALLAEKLAIIDSMMSAAGADAKSARVSVERRRWLQESLYRMPVADLRTMALQGSPDALGAAIATAYANDMKDGLAKLGQPGTELVYYPITPCRYIDTRNLGPRPWSTPVGVRAYDLDTTGATYGGVATCDPRSVVGGVANRMGAIAINIAIVDPGFFPGFFGARPFGSTNSTSLVNWYESGATVQLSNAGIVTTTQSLTTEEIEFFGTSTHYVVDVLGVFAAPTSTPLDCVTGTLTQTAVNSTTRDYSLQASGCPTGYGIVSNSCNAIGDLASVRQAGGGVVTAADARCIGRYEGASSATIINVPWCCRLPGR